MLVHCEVIDDIAFMGSDDICYFGHAAVTYFEGIPVAYLVYTIAFREVTPVKLCWCIVTYVNIYI